MLSKTASGATVYYHTNALGSVTDLTSSTGSVIEKYKYDIYGKPTIYPSSGLSPLASSAYGNRFMFTGREFLTEVNLYDYRNRVYSADLGRFLQTDPLKDAERSQGPNLYEFVGNDPTNGRDPFGLTPIDDAGNAAAADAANRTRKSNPKVEYCGLICKKCDGTIYTTGPIAGGAPPFSGGEKGNCNPDSAPCNSGDTKIGVYHSHPSSDGPSPADYKYNQNNGGIPGYLGNDNPPTSKGASSPVTTSKY